MPAKPPASIVDWLSVVFHSITMAFLAFSFVFRVIRIIKQPTVVNWSFGVILFLTFVDLLLQILNQYVFSSPDLSTVWRLMSIFLSVPYILTQIFILFQFRDSLKIQPSFPQGLAIGSIVIHLIMCVPGYSYITSRFAHQDGYLGMFYLMSVWYVYLIVLDNYINVMLLRTITATLEAFKSKEFIAEIKNRLRNYVIAVACLDLFGIILNLIGGLSLDSDHLIPQELVSNAILGCHVATGSWYLITVVSQLKMLGKKGSAGIVFASGTLSSTPQTDNGTNSRNLLNQ